MTPLTIILAYEVLIPIIAIIAVFGVGGLIILKILQMIRESLQARRKPVQSDAVLRKLEQYEQRHEQLIKRIQNLETIIVDADLGNPDVKMIRSGQDDEGRESDRPLKNKLR